MHRDLRNQLICALLVLSSIVISWPVLEMGVNDDWSYAYTAKRLAETGRLTYNGWAGFPLGVQAYWGALWVKVFGFSFTLVRLTILPFAIGNAWILYALLRKARIEPPAALLGTLTIVLSPLVVPCATSFMSDVSSLFFILTALYGYICSVEAEPNSRVALRWIIGATLMGLLGTTIRQSVWLVPVLGLPFVAWIRFHERRFVIYASILWIASVIAGTMLLKWYGAQPYSVSDDPFSGARYYIHHPVEALIAPILMTLTLALLLFPVLVGRVISVRSMKNFKPWAWVLIILFVLAGLFRCYRKSAFAPWYPSVLTINGVYGNILVIGELPRVLSPQVCALLSACALVLTVMTAALLIQQALEQTPGNRIVWPVALKLSLPIIGIYAILAFLRFGIFDRYLIPIMPVAVMVLLWSAQQARSGGERCFGWLSLAVMAIYGVAATHDHFAMGRARVEAASLLTHRGIERTQIMAGVDFDGWTQLVQQGYMGTKRDGHNINSQGVSLRRSKIPPAIECQKWFYDQIPAINMSYAVVSSRQATLTDMRIGPVEYKAWLPPFRRWVWLQRMPNAPEPPLIAQPVN